jgi:hypothetical protein
MMTLSSLLQCYGLTLLLMPRNACHFVAWMRTNLGILGDARPRGESLRAALRSEWASTFETILSWDLFLRAAWTNAVAEEVEG